MGFTPDDFKAMQMRVDRANGRLNQPESAPGPGVSKEIEELHEPALRWLKAQFPPVPFFYARPDKPSGMMPGTPDLGILIRGKIILIEFKRADGKLKPDQLAWKLMAERQGFTVEVVRTFARFLELVSADIQPPC